MREWLAVKRTAFNPDVLSFLPGIVEILREVKPLGLGKQGHGLDFMRLSTTPKRRGSCDGSRIVFEVFQQSSETRFIFIASPLTAWVTVSLRLCVDPRSYSWRGSRLKLLPP
jgi:hypothetical protein